jgi:hypothetical protein
MGALPINSRALWTPGKMFLLVKDKIRNYSFCLLPRDCIEENIAEEAPGKKSLFF